jgi:hypothetical protein
LHGWPPKLAARYFNMNIINNTNKIYCYLYLKYHPGQVAMPIKEAVHNLTHLFLQRGEPMRQRGYGAPPSATKDITTSSSREGKQVRRDSVRQPFVPEPHAHGMGAVHSGVDQTPIDYSSPRGRHYQQCAFSRRRLQQPWRVHQPVPMLVRGLDGKGSGPRCQYRKCPGYDQKTVIIRVPFKTVYRCEECSMNWTILQRRYRALCSDNIET